MTAYPPLPDDPTWGDLVRGDVIEREGLLSGSTLTWTLADTPTPDPSARDRLIIRVTSTIGDFEINEPAGRTVRQSLRTLIAVHPSPEREAR